MENQKQMITVIQKGPIVEFEQELESPMKDGMYLPNVKYLEMKSVFNYGSVRFWIMKGVSVGGGQARSNSQLTEVDEGYLSISQKNLMFAGQSTTISIPLKKLLESNHILMGLEFIKKVDKKNIGLVGEIILI